MRAAFLSSRTSRFLSCSFSTDDSIPGHAGGSEEGLKAEERRVLGIVVRVLTLEASACADCLKESLAIGILAVSGTPESPSVTVDDDTIAKDLHTVHHPECWAGKVHCSS